MPCAASNKPAAGPALFHGILTCRSAKVAADAADSDRQVGKSPVRSGWRGASSAARWKPCRTAPGEAGGE